MTTPRARRAGEVLLRSFAQDVSPAHAKRKTLLALGSGAVVASVGVQTAAAAKTANLAGGSAYAGAGVLKVAVVKAAIIGALCGVATLEGAHYLETSSSKPPVVALSARGAPPSETKASPQNDRALEPPHPVDVPPPPADPNEPASVQGAPDPLSQPAHVDRREPQRRSESTVVPRPQLEGEAAERVEVAEPAPSFAPVRSAPSGEIAPLSEEIRLVDGARGALVAADPRRALRDLDSYALAFPNGKLAEEATVLRIEVLVKLGDRASAERLAGEFVRAHPASGHLRKIRSILSNGARD
jgi:hypothetical protein